MDRINGLFDYIAASTDALHAVASAADMLRTAGYTELLEGEDWQLADGGKYYVIRGGSSIIAFNYKSALKSFAIVATHSDSPSFRVKCEPELIGAYSRLNVERYGGPIYYTWLDRPLSISGRVAVSTECGVELRLVDLDRDSFTIPSVAPHLNREVNKSFGPNPAVDLIPLYTMGKDGGKLLSEIAACASTTEDRILSYDLFLYNRERGRRFGKDGEFILAPRIDDLASVYASLVAFLEARDSATTPVFALFDNEEVGSSTKQGAASTFLADTLERIAADRDTYRRALASSLLVSADNAHAVHPNHPELSDPKCNPVLNGGVVVKYNADQRYTTDGVSDAIFRAIAARAGVKLQSYTNRADLPGGSTLGSIATTRVSVSAVDIGLPQLAMHSASETAGANDIEDMITVLRELYSTSFSFRGGKIEF